jgi:Phage integrase family
LLKAISHTNVYWPVLIALATGMRRGEIVALRWKNVDLDRGVVRVVESLEQTRKGGLRFKSTKTEKARAVTLPRFAVEELRRWKREQAEGLFTLGVRQGGETLVCARLDGEPKKPDSLTNEFLCLMRKAGIPRVRFHDLRHSHATQLLSAGVHPKIVQERLGHSTITLTLDLYSHVSETMQSEAAARLDQAYGLNTQPTNKNFFMVPHVDEWSFITLNLLLAYATTVDLPWCAKGRIKTHPRPAGRLAGCECPEVQCINSDCPEGLDSHRNPRSAIAYPPSRVLG